jgi:hypothetical protein
MIIIFAVLLELKYFATNSPYGNGELTAIVDDKPPGKCFMRIKTYPSKVGYFIMPKASTFKSTLVLNLILIFLPSLRTDVYSCGPSNSSRGSPINACSQATFFPSHSFYFTTAFGIEKESRNEKNETCIINDWIL